MRRTAADPLECMADELLRAAGRSRDDEYPCYTEEYLAEKRRAHEDRYASPPEVESVIDAEIDEMAAADLLHFGSLAGLTEKQSDTWECYADGFSIADIVRIRAGAGHKVSHVAVMKCLEAARAKVARIITDQRYFGWYIVYLETVTGRRLY